MTLTCLESSKTSQANLTLLIPWSYNLNIASPLFRVEFVQNFSSDFLLYLVTLLLDTLLCQCTVTPEPLIIPPPPIQQKNHCSKIRSLKAGQKHKFGHLLLAEVFAGFFADYSHEMFFLESITFNCAWIYSEQTICSGGNLRRIA